MREEARMTKQIFTADELSRHIDTLETQDNHLAVRSEPRVFVVSECARVDRVLSRDRAHGLTRYVRALLRPFFAASYVSDA